MWSIGNLQQDTAVYNIPSGSRYMSGSVFNEWQDFAFEPGQVSVSSGQYAGNNYAVGTVFVNLTDSQGYTVASWSHTFNYFSTVDPQYVYVNPMFSIPSGSPQPIDRIVFTNWIGSLDSTIGFKPYFSTNGAGLMSFAEATGYDNTLNNGQPENDEPNLGWYGYTTPSASVSWAIPTGTTSYEISWSTAYAVAITYNGLTEYGTSGSFSGSLSASQITGSLEYWVNGAQTVQIYFTYNVET